MPPQLVERFFQRLRAFDRRLPARTYGAARRRRQGALSQVARMRVRSKRYSALASKRRERERRLACERKRSHGELANRILGQGTTVNREALLSVLAEAVRQEREGSRRRHVRQRRAQQAKLLPAANGLNSGQGRLAFPSSAMWMAPTGKKPLSQRYHHFPDGTRVGRDLYFRLSRPFRSG